MRLRVLLVVALLLTAGAASAGFYAYKQFDAPGPLPSASAVVVPHGGLEQAANALEREHVVAHAWQLRLAAFLTKGHGSIRAAELEFPAAASLRQTLDVLRSGKPVQHHLTIPEGLTAAQVALLVDGAPALDGETPLVPEGSILPQTYAYERGYARAALLDRATAAMQRTIEEDWSTRAPDLPLSSPRDLIILASIVERETGKSEERKLVAAVFLNRLRLGMKLQSDPTVIYGVTGGLGTLDHGLTRAELDQNSPYNTYRVAGLPPGPICMPGPASLRAVTQPATSDALFFVADGTGGHVFARTETDHLRNVAHWRDVERARATQ